MPFRREANLDSRHIDDDGYTQHPNNDENSRPHLRGRQDVLGVIEKKELSQSSSRQGCLEDR